MNPARRLRRVVIAVDSAPGAERSLQAGIALAAQLQAEIEARFLEDEDLHRLADLPFSRRFGVGFRDPFPRQSLEAELRLLADTARRAFDDAVRQRGLTASFRVQRERLVLEAVVPSEGEVVMVGWTRRVRTSVGRVDAPEAGPLRVYFDRSEASLDALRAAEEMKPTRIVVLHADTGAGDAEDAEEATRAIRAAVRAARLDDDIALVFRSVDGDEPGRALHAALRAEDGGYLVLSRRQPAAATLVREARHARVPVDILIVE